MNHQPSSSVATRQWSAIAGAWVVYGLLLAIFAASILAATRIPLGQKFAVVLFLVFLWVTEVGLLVLLNVILERLGGRLAGGRSLDAAKGLGLGILTAVLTGSLIKFRITGVHLRITDIGFLAGNWRQLAQESQVAELAVAGTLAAVCLLVAAASAGALHRLRHRGRSQPVPQVAVLTLLALVGLLYTGWAYPTVRRFAALVLPEAQWFALPLADAGSKWSSGGAGSPPSALGPTIQVYRPDPVAGRPNILLIMLESVPWQRTAAGGGRAGVTPHLDRLMTESVVFSRAYTTSTHSDYAQMAVLSSLYPRKFNRHDFYKAIQYPRTLLWDVLRPAGYRTAMFSCQNERWGSMLTFLSTPGLELLRHSPDWPDARHKGTGLESKVFEETPVEAWRDWRRQTAPGPWFAYLNFQANHFPYQLPPEAERPWQPAALDFSASFFRYPRDKTPVLLNRFYNALRDSDRYLGEMRAILEASGEWDDTIVIVVSDHGEAFYEHDEPTHGTSLYEEQVRSLLVMRLPGVAPRRVDQPVSLLDLAPTLIRHLGLPPHGNFQGRGDILAPRYSAGGRPILFTIQGVTFEDGLILDGWKYTINWDRRLRRLFDLEADPEERRNRLHDDPDRARRMDDVLMSLLARQLTYYDERGWEQDRYAAPLP